MALTVSTGFIFVLNSRINVKNYEDIILTTLHDIEKDIEDTGDINMLEATLREKEQASLLLRVKADVDRFAGGAEQFDDITMLSTRYL